MSYNNLEGIDLVNCVNSRCGKKPDMSDLKYNVPQQGIFNATNPNSVELFFADKKKFEDCAKDCAESKASSASSTTKRPPVVTSSTAVNIALNNPTATKDTDAQQIMDTRPYQVEETISKFPKSAKIGLGLGAGLLLLYVGYRLIKKSKKAE